MPPQTAVTGLSFSPDGAFAVSMAAGDRQLAVWALGGKVGKKRKAQQPALATLTLQETAIHICTAPAPDAQAFQVLPPFCCNFRSFWGQQDSMLECKTILGYPSN